jgi:hypothetical protein
MARDRAGQRDAPARTSAAPSPPRDQPVIRRRVQADAVPDQALARRLAVALVAAQLANDADVLAGDGGGPRRLFGGGAVRLGRADGSRRRL